MSVARFIGGSAAVVGWVALCGAFAVRVADAGWTSDARVLAAFAIMSFCLWTLLRGAK